MAEKEFMTGRPAIGVVVPAAGVVFLVVLLDVTGFTCAVAFAEDVSLALLLLAEGVQAKQKHRIAIETRIDKVVLFKYISF
ncbi:MAG: hypothetical protein NTZ34_04625 [Chloroflexi bacterium]|nr:hypothetical protein [Chloroflexota bacterium]